MEVDIVIAIALATAAILIVTQVMRTVRTFAMHRTIREAIIRDSNLTPELLASVDEGKAAPGGGDDRIAVVLIALGLAVIGFGLINGDADDIRNTAAISLFPLFVGIALLGRYWIRRRRGAEG